MPKLAINETSLLVNGINNTFPGDGMFFSVNLWSTHPSSGKLGDLGALSDDKACTCALRVVLQHQVVGKGVLDVKGIFSNVATGSRHRSHHDTILELLAANGDLGEDAFVSHG